MQTKQKTREVLEGHMKKFRIRMIELWTEKNKLFSLFRSNLEEKKTQEIKNNLSAKNQ